MILGSDGAGTVVALGSGVRVQVPIAAEYPLAAASEAHKRLEGGHLLGKIVLRVH
jgi:NADPH:quinone reductase-like Zn-dependent oxidoreductase